jgi:hypothetical protein
MGDRALAPWLPSAPVSARQDTWSWASQTLKNPDEPQGVGLPIDERVESLTYGGKRGDDPVLRRLTTLGIARRRRRGLVLDELRLTCGGWCALTAWRIGTGMVTVREGRGAGARCESRPRTARVNGARGTTAGDQGRGLNRGDVRTAPEGGSEPARLANVTTWSGRSRGYGSRSPSTRGCDDPCAPGDGTCISSRPERRGRSKAPAAGPLRCSAISTAAASAPNPEPPIPEWAPVA